MKLKYGVTPNPSADNQYKYPVTVQLLSPEEARKERCKQFRNYIVPLINHAFYDEVVIDLDAITGAAGAKEAQSDGIEWLKDAGWCVRTDVYNEGIMNFPKLLHISPPDHQKHGFRLEWLRCQCMQAMLERPDETAFETGFCIELEHERRIVSSGHSLDPIGSFIVADNVVQEVVREMALLGWAGFIVEGRSNTLYFVPATLDLSGVNNLFVLISSEDESIRRYLWRSPLKQVAAR